MEKLKELGVTQVVYDNMVANDTIDENTLYYIIDFNKVTNVVNLGNDHILITCDGIIWETFDKETWKSIKNPIDIDEIYEFYSKQTQSNNRIIEKLYKEGLL